MTDEELLEIVGNLRVLGSDVADVEAKRAQGQLPKSLRETLSAFSNGSGGIIILGLHETNGFEVTGVDDPAKMSADLSSLCADNMEPPLRPLIGIHQIDGKHVLVAEIPEIPNDQKPAYYKGAGITQGSYIRVGDGDRRLTSYEVQLMLSSRGQPTDDETLTDATVEHLNHQAVRQLIARLRSARPYAFQDLSDELILERVRVTKYKNDRKLVTVFGLLALGDYPQEFFPQLMLSFVSYPTNDGPDEASDIRFLDNKVIEGPIPIMVRDTLNVIRRNMSRRAVVTGAGRQDVWEYPETALREAITNALVHRDYSPTSLGTQVQVEMYPDRLVVRNPGGLFGPVTVDALGEEGVSSARNAQLLRILEDVPIPGETRTVCENRGSGIRAMITSLRAAGMSPPQFQNKISSFSVTFPNHALLSAEVIGWIGELNEKGLNDSQCIGLAMLREGQILDNKSYRTATGLDSRKATTELGDLVARELVIQTGSRRWAQYRLSPRAMTASATARVSERRLPPADRRDEILNALGENTLSRSEISAITGVNDKTVRRWLGRLRQEGRIEIAGGVSPQSNNARYRQIGPRAEGTDDEQSTLF